MLKRLTLVAMFTGSAQLTTLLALKYLASTVTAGQLSALGEIDSLVNLIVNLVALGLLMSSVRDIAISQDWEHEIDKAQIARLTMAICLVPLAIRGLYYPNYWIFLFAPIFALNADYALYGRSYPVLAAIISFGRVLIPYLCLLCVVPFHPQWAIATFFISSVLVYGGAGFFITRFFHRPYWHIPSWKSLRLYWQSLGLGIVSLSYYFIGLGLIPVAVYFYKEDAIAVAYVGCKVYVIFKGVLRIIGQSFIREMLDPAVQLQVDRLAGFAGFLFVATAVCYPSTFIGLFLSKALHFDRQMLMVLAAAGLVAAMLMSYTNKAVLEKKDKPYSIVAAIASLSAICLCIIYSRFSPSPAGIFFGILAGELISVIGLIKICGEWDGLISRALIWGKYLLLMMIPVTARLCWGDSYLALFAGAGLMSVVFLAIFHKKLRL